MTILTSTLPGFAYCYNDLNNSVNGRSALVLASVGAQDLKALAPSALAPQTPQTPYPSFLQSYSVGGVPGQFPVNGTPELGITPTAGGFNLGQTVA